MIHQETGYKISRNEKKAPKETFFPIPNIIPDVKKGSHRFVIGTVPTQTSKAYLITLYGTGYWLPKTQVIVGLDSHKVYVVDIPEWLIKAKNIPM